VVASCVRHGFFRNLFEVVPPEAEEDRVTITANSRPRRSEDGESYSLGKSPTGRKNLQAYLVAPIFVTVPTEVLFATQMLVPSKATPQGLFPTAYVPTSAPVLASNLVTLFPL
jgi:hypothetical protein